MIPAGIQMGESVTTLNNKPTTNPTKAQTKSLPPPLLFFFFGSLNL
jgi:hypothetical protein